MASPGTSGSPRPNMNQIKIGLTQFTDLSPALADLINNLQKFSVLNVLLTNDGGIVVDENGNPMFKG